MPPALHWREHAAASNAAGCGANAAFVTFVSGDRYVPGAVCLRRSIAGAGNRCPMDVVYDDRLPERNLSADSFALLANTFGTERVFSLARIMADHPTSIADMHRWDTTLTPDGSELQHACKRNSTLVRTQSSTGKHQTTKA